MIIAFRRHGCLALAVVLAVLAADAFAARPTRAENVGSPPAILVLTRSLTLADIKTRAALERYLGVSLKENDFARGSYEGTIVLEPNSSADIGFVVGSDGYRRLDLEVKGRCIDLRHQLAMFPKAISRTEGGHTGIWGTLTKRQAGLKVELRQPMSDRRYCLESINVVPEGQK